MPTLAMTNAYIYADAFDLTGNANEVSLTADATQLDRTTFRSGGWSQYQMGAKNSALSVAGLADPATVDLYQWQHFGVTGVPVTLADVETEGIPTAMLQSIQMDYRPLEGSFNELAAFGITGASSDAYGVVRGRLAKAMGAVSAVGAIGTGLQLGAASSTQFLYATLHLFGTAGTTITVVVESSAAPTFTSPTTRMTLGPYTTVGGRWATRVAGPITDTYYRMRVSAITGTWTVAGAIAVQ